MKLISNSQINVLMVEIECCFQIGFLMFCMTDIACADTSLERSSRA